MKTSRRDTLKYLGMAMAAQSIPSGIFASGSNLAGNANVFSETGTAFNPADATWQIDWPEKLSQYDLVYLSPPVDPMQGIPLGNGDTGVLIWCEESTLICAINKSDLWDDAVFKRFGNWNKEQEDLSTTLRHACRLIVDFKFPVFSTLYLSSFKGRLSISDASVSISADSPFGKISFEGFVDHASGNFLYALKTDFEEDVPIEISMERFGSRTFSHWYSQINRDAAIGTTGTQSKADDRGIFITQHLAGGDFTIAATILKKNDTEVRYLREHSRRAIILLEHNLHKEVQGALLVTSPQKGSSEIIASNLLSGLDSGSFVAMRSIHYATWKSIWARSFMDYGNDYLNNLWYLTIFYANASQGGAYPGRFTNGLWGWNRDVQNWNFYFHWNQQQIYWPLNAAGYHELIMPYLDFRYKSLPFAREDAKEIFKANGAFIADVTERRGYNSVNESHNHTPVAEIALEFWRQYQYTGDKEFLKEKAIPFITDAARFFQSLFKKGPDGLYHAQEGTGYEGWIILKDGLTEIVYARALFSTALYALKEAGLQVDEAGAWEDILRNLAPIPVAPMEPGTVRKTGESYILERGCFKGWSVQTDQVAAAGWGIKEQKMLTTYSASSEDKYFGNALNDGIFPSVPSAPVFPSGVVSISNYKAQEDLFKLMKATTLLYGPGITGWDPVPIVMARLGLTEALKLVLDHFPERWQIYCNGWGHWGVEGEINKDAELFFRTNNVRDIKAPNGQDKFPLPMWPFRHMSMESLSVLAAAMNESLIQSHDGIIRIAPAFPTDRAGRFTLHATGGFVVSAEIISGVVQWVCIKSILGNKCRIQLPWDKANAFVKSRKTRLSAINGMAEFKTSAGEIIMLLPPDVKITPWVARQEKPIKNNSVKYHSSGKAQLGIPQQF